MTLGVSTVFVEVEEALGTTSLIMNGGSAVQIFFLGIGNVLFVPLTHSKLPSTINHAYSQGTEFGRRPVYLGTLVILLASQFVQMNMKTPGQMIGAFVLSGLGAAPFDVLVEISVGPERDGITHETDCGSCRTSSMPTREAP